MKINEITVTRNGDEKYDFHWDDDRVGFATTVDGEEIGFFLAKSKFDRAAAQEAARKLMVKTRGEARLADQQRIEYEFQYNRPLSELELEWVGMMKRFMTLNDKELARWESLNQIVRKSLHDGSHPIMKEEK